MRDQAPLHSEGRTFAKALDVQDKVAVVGHDGARFRRSSHS
jgi:hypothetical protein